MTGDDHHKLNLDLPVTLATGEAGADRRDGLSWTWDLDIEALLAAITGPAPWTRGAVKAPGRPTAATAPRTAPDPADVRTPPAARAPAASPAAADPAVMQAAAEPSDATADPALDQADADLAEYLDAVEAGRSQIIPLPVVAGRVAETLPTGPGLAGWLGASEPDGLEDGALAGIAASYRRLASWAQAGELTVVAELASRSAAANDRVGVGEDGRPVKIPVDACAEVSLALTMSQSAATWWADLAVTLRWRLAATGAALAAGQIDLARARAIAEATVWLDDEKAQAVQDRILPKAGSQTTAQLRAALRRAVIAADPGGADRRREEAEKQAKVMLYPDADGTASLGGYSLPGIPATAAMARISALARALQATGAGGGIDRLRAHVFVGLLLGTLPYIPPAAGAPPDDGPSGGAPQDGNQPGAGQRGGGATRGRTPADCPGNDDHRDPRGPYPGYGHLSSDREASSADDDLGWARPPPSWPQVPAYIQPGPGAMDHLPPAAGAGGLLDLRLDWTTLTGESSQPGHLSRLGPLTATQARHLAHLAATDPSTRWQIIVTGPDGQAVATTRLARHQADGQAGLVKQITVTIGLDCLTGTSATAEDLPPELDRILRVARSLAGHAERRAAADVRADGGCAHADATASYRPTIQLRDYITARDQTCRFPTCRQPVWRCDLDHTTPFDQGGRTCSCNLGGLCRFHHKIKGLLRWYLDQSRPGIFTWTTPTGRQYTTRPDSHAA